MFNGNGSFILLNSVYGFGCKLTVFFLQGIRNVPVGKKIDKSLPLKLGLAQMKTQTITKEGALTSFISNDNTTLKKEGKRLLDQVRILHLEIVINSSNNEFLLVFVFENLLKYTTLWRQVL